MACNCGPGANCRCAVQPATPSACDPITVTVTGIGSAASPYLVGATLDLTRIFDLDNACLGLTTTTVEGCTVITSACAYRFV